jgi:hypothetical protein
MESKSGAWPGVYLALFEQVGACLVKLGGYGAELLEIGLLVYKVMKSADIEIVIRLRGAVPQATGSTTLPGTM